MQQHAVLPAVFEKVENFFDIGKFKIESAVDEFELPDAAAD